MGGPRTRALGASMNYRDRIVDATATPPGDKATVRRLYYHEQQDLTTVARSLGCSRQRLARWMQWWGMKRRAHRDAMEIKRRQLGHQRGPNWKGGRWFLKKQQTEFTYAPWHPRARHNGGVPTYVLVAEEKLGRLLRKMEVVHHLDLDRTNNDETNLCVMLRMQHGLLHDVLGRIGIALLVNGHSTLVLNHLHRRDVAALARDVYVQRLFCVSENVYPRVWDDVKPLIAPILDDRFIVLNKE